MQQCREDGLSHEVTDDEIPVSRAIITAKSPCPLTNDRFAVVS